MGQFVRLIAEQAAYYGRTVVTVDRWFPSSKTCSTCGLLMDAMPESPIPAIHGGEHVK